MYHVFCNSDYVVYITEATRRIAEIVMDIVVYLAVTCITAITTGKHAFSVITSTIVIYPWDVDQPAAV